MRDSAAATPPIVSVPFYYVAFGTMAVLIGLTFLYVIAPFAGWISAPPPSFGVLMAISMAFATHTLLRPPMGLLYAPLFMILATALVPQTFPQAGQSAPPEYFIWATGLFCIAAALSLRLPWAGMLRNGRERTAPLSLVVFLGICGAASVQGLRLGIDVSFVVRQLYGAALLIIFFFAAVSLPEVEMEIAKYFRVLKWFGMAASIFTIVLYVENPNAPGNVDSFKWGLSIYCAMLAVYCMAEAATARGWLTRVGLAVQALILVAQPFASAARAATGIAGVTGILAIAMLIKSKKMKALILAACLSAIFAIIFIDMAGPLIDMLPYNERLSALIPESILSDPSFVGRTNQLLNAMEVVQLHPLLGGGLGSSLVYVDPSLGGVTDVAAIDQGFAYIISKFGILGLVSFCWLVFAAFHSSGWPERNAVHIGAFVLFLFSVLFMISHPVMLQFIGAGFVGVIGGVLFRFGAQRGKSVTEHQDTMMSAS